MPYHRNWTTTPCCICNVTIAPPLSGKKTLVQHKVHYYLIRGAGLPLYVPGIFLWCSYLTMNVDHAFVATLVG